MFRLASLQEMSTTSLVGRLLSCNRTPCIARNRLWPHQRPDTMPTRVAAEDHEFVQPIDCLGSGEPVPTLKYAVAIRVEPLHQCTDSARHNDKHGRPVAAVAYRGTAIAILDNDLQVVAHTWLVSAPKHHVDPSEVESRWTIGYNASDNFAPPWNAPA